MALLLTSASYASLAQTANPSVAQNAPTVGRAGTTVDETARFLAGMPVTGVLEPLTHDPAWQEHAQAMNEAWTRKERQQIWPIRQWMQANAPQYHRSNDTVFYMFSGPDFCTPAFFFRCRATTSSQGSNRSAMFPILLGSHPKCCAPIWSRCAIR